MHIVITGATKGIGLAIAKLFAEKGFSLTLCARTLQDLESLRTALLTQNPSISVRIFRADLAQKEEAQNFGKYCIEIPEIDILINNAGIFLPGNIYDEPEGTLEQLIATNVYSAYHVTRAIVPAMMQRRKGHIFNITSVAGINAYDAGGSYAISKFALTGFSKNLRQELKNYNIRVTSVIPGATLTDSWKGTTYPDSRFIDADDIAKMIWSAYDVSERTIVEEILIRPAEGDL